MTLIPGYYTFSEAAAVLQRSVSQVSRYVRNGLLPAIDLGHQKVIEQVNVHNFTPPPRGNPLFGEDFGNGRKKTSCRNSRQNQ